MNGRIDPVGTAGLERHRETARLEGSLVGCGVHTDGQTRDDDQPGPGEPRSQIPGDRPPVVCGRPGADDRHRRRPKQRGVPSDHQQRGSVDQPAQALRVGGGGQRQ